MSKSGANHLFRVSLSSVKRYMSIANRGSSLWPRKGGGRSPKTDQTTEELLEDDVKERPAATVAQRHHFLERMAGKAMSDSTIRRLLG